MSLQSVLPAKAGIPLRFDQIGGDFNFFTASFASRAGKPGGGITVFY